MNEMGKYFLKFLFVVATLLLCKSCANYFQEKEQSFTCPICEIIKGFRVQPKSNLQIYSLAMVSNNTSCRGEWVCFNQDDAYIETLEVSKLDWTNKDGSSKWQKCVIRDHFLERKKIYLWFKMLKIFTAKV